MADEKKDDGGPAFPQYGPTFTVNETIIPPPRGMKLRDYFAAHAPPMDDDWASVRRTDPEPHLVPEEELRILTEWRYAYADAMLAARAR